MTNATNPSFTVLYADDDADDLDLVQEAFQHHADNFSLVTACDGLEAVSYLQSLPTTQPTPCLIILDINMPRMDGKEALRRIRSLQRFQKTPVVLFTTSANPDDRAFARRFDAGFITKPVNAQQLAVFAEQMLAHCTDDARQHIQRNVFYK